MSRDWSYRVWDKQEKTYSDKAFSIDQHGIPYVQDEDGYWEEASARYVFEFSTGLKDMNGKMIREGDILEFTTVKQEYEKDARRGTVVFYKDSFCVYDDVYIALGRVNNSQWHKCVVIGNIHENPELLGGEE